MINPFELKNFNKKVKITEGCWLWLGALDKDGYGKTSVDGKSYRAHRLSLAFGLGREIGVGLYACHECDNPCCVRPDHLFEGTVVDNKRDSKMKGRDLLAGYQPGHSMSVGEKHPSAKLTEEKVKDILIRSGLGQRNKDIAEIYGVSPSLISYIKTGKIWGHIKK